MIVPNKELKRLLTRKIKFFKIRVSLILLRQISSPFTVGRKLCLGQQRDKTNHAVRSSLRKRTEEEKELACAQKGRELVRASRNGSQKKRNIKSLKKTQQKRVGEKRERKKSVHTENYINSEIKKLKCLP